MHTARVMAIFTWASFSSCTAFLGNVRAFVALLVGVAALKPISLSDEFDCCSALNSSASKSLMVSANELLALPFKTLTRFLVTNLDGLPGNLDRPIFVF